MLIFLFPTALGLSSDLQPPAGQPILLLHMRLAELQDDEGSTYGFLDPPTELVFHSSTLLAMVSRARHPGAICRCRVSSLSGSFSGLFLRGSQPAMMIGPLLLKFLDIRGQPSQGPLYPTYWQGSPSSLQEFRSSNTAQLSTCAYTSPDMQIGCGLQPP
ncbi:uncharacterized protein BCR38DRAFT_145367 [Pseudomassariella vexata]|uniref:Uncharacterized protein n=1 Tax=Pseudomassariella vexata TaxID=1141098 RepID=A0A1Y2D6Q7_9PEZI|nr:uncharacterized protein BCR38DRAFT_145367 [Pseudomassariella vexata]ORY54968.1 hypothetical protein BCR38DRAFT_145367 [Pseudomassariella vexata]